MSDIAFYNCTYLQSSSKVGNLKQDGNGYFEIVVGAFDCENVHNEMYAFTSQLKQQFDPGGIMHRRLSKSLLRGECGHPVFHAGMTAVEFFQRVQLIEMTNVAHHIKSIRFEESRDHTGKVIVLTIAVLAPSGPHHDMTMRMLNNAEENVAYSIRSLTTAIMHKGREAKDVRAIITWDLVAEPGISVSTKYGTPTLESYGNEMVITPEILTASQNLVMPAGIKMESAVDTTYIRSSLGWQKIELLSDRSASNWK